MVGKTRSRFQIVFEETLEKYDINLEELVGDSGLSKGYVKKVRGQYWEPSSRFLRKVMRTVQYKLSFNDLARLSCLGVMGEDLYDSSVKDFIEGLPEITRY